MSLVFDQTMCYKLSICCSYMG